MTNCQEDFIDTLVDDLSNIVASLGINRVAGQLYILLFFSQEPLSLDEMTKRLKISKGHVSTNIRALERWNAVRKIWVKGSRKDYYEANCDTLKIILIQLKLGLNQRFDELDKIINNGKNKIESIKKNNTQESIEVTLDFEKKIKQVEKMEKELRRLLDALKFFPF
ncbi:MAG: hypothetical protein HY810_02905 [Candidatus Omnitrophica bacterium]|nr:hypothetical protein [Candidatus Omnitrophota bacterium]